MTRRSELVFIIGVFLLSSAVSAQEKLTIEQIVARHLDSVGTPQARAAVRSRVADAKVQFKEVITGKVQFDGTARLLSQGRKMKCAIQFPVQQYRGEQFVFDGNSTQVAMTDPGQRSLLGNFLFTQQEILSEGLFGGTTFMAWPLLDLQERKAKLKYEGLKKTGDAQLHELTYIPRKRNSNGELVIHVYLEPETFRHVLTRYQLSLYNQLGEGGTQGNDELRYTVEEHFSEFRLFDGLTLPSHWQIRFRKDRGAAQELLWDFTLTSLKHNAL